MSTSTFDRIDPHKLQCGAVKVSIKGNKRYYPGIGLPIRDFFFAFKRLSYKTASEAKDEAWYYRDLWCKEYDRAKAKWDAKHKTTSLVGMTQEERDAKIAEMMK